MKMQVITKVLPLLLLKDLQFEATLAEPSIKFPFEFPLST